MKWFTDTKTDTASMLKLQPGFQALFPRIKAPLSRSTASSFSKGKADSHFPLQSDFKVICLKSKQTKTLYIPLQFLAILNIFAALVYISQASSILVFPLRKILK